MSGYSALVTMELVLSTGERLPVAQSAKDWLLLCEPVERPPCSAVLVVHVDGVRSERPCSLPLGISGRRVVYCPPGGAP